MLNEKSELINYFVHGSIQTMKRLITKILLMFHGKNGWQESVLVFPNSKSLQPTKEDNKDNGTWQINLCILKGRCSNKQLSTTSIFLHKVACSALRGLRLCYALPSNILELRVHMVFFFSFFASLDAYKQWLLRGLGELFLMLKLVSRKRIEKSTLSVSTSAIISLIVFSSPMLYFSRACSNSSTVIYLWKKKLNNFTHLH